MKAKEARILIIDWGKGEHGALCRKVASSTIVIAWLPDRVAISKSEAEYLDKCFDVYSTYDLPASEETTGELLVSRF